MNTLFITDYGNLYALFDKRENNTFEDHTTLSHAAKASEHRHFSKWQSHCEIVQDMTHFSIVEPHLFARIAFIYISLVNNKVFDYRIVPCVQAYGVQKIIIVIIYFLIGHFHKLLNITKYVKALIV